MGKRVIFFGSMLFQRYPGSKIEIGDNCVFRSAFWSNIIGINRRCFISTRSQEAVVQIRESCGFSGTVICAQQEVIIGSRVMCGANVTITDSDMHAIEVADRIAKNQPESSPVMIGNDVWLGMNVAVLKGVKIGDGATVCANSVVTKDVPSGVLAGGMPARMIRKL